MRLDDAPLHARGEGHFVDDERPAAGMLFACVVGSNIAHGLIARIDAAAALALPGVATVLTAADIPGKNLVGNVSEDEVLLADKEVVYHGQALALVVAESEALARQAGALLDIAYLPLPAVFDVREADRLGMHIAPKQVMCCGDLEAAWAECDIIVQGAASTGGQEHMYLETQAAIAYPLENRGLRILSATQSPGMTQRIVAKVLKLAMHKIEVDVHRLGGGFGGKEEQATPFAALAALAALRLQKPVKLVLRRPEDCRITGKRHPYEADYRLGLDANGKILAYRVDFYQNAGAYADLSLAILERTMFHAGNAYFIPNMQVGAVSCRTHLPPNTAFRGFGGPQAMFVLESAICHAASVLGVDAGQIQQRNLLREGQHFHYGMQAERCLAQAAWQALAERDPWADKRRQIAAYNVEHPLSKKGLALMPVCFGIAFTATFLNQADALVHVYADGSVSVSCGAVEMGQGVRQKIAKVAADCLGVSLQRVKVESTNTSRVANMSPTAASTGADLNGQATLAACLQIKQRLLDVAAAMLDMTGGEPLELRHERVLCQGQPSQIRWKSLVGQAYQSRVALSAQAHYATPDLYFDREQNQGKPFAYHVYGCAGVEVTLDCLRGTYRIDRVGIVHDVGHSLDWAVDRGQVEGAVVQGLGWMTLEQVVFGPDGRLLSDSLSRYKIPDLHFAPAIDVHFLPVVENPPGLLHSKAVGEPPLMYGIGAYFALVDAIRAFNPAWQADFCAPLTPEKVLLALYDPIEVPT